MVAEISANHGGDVEVAVRTIDAAKEAGADAVKVQTYTPDTMTIRSNRDEFRVGEGTLWEGRELYELYQEATTPWEWHPVLKQKAVENGLDFFSSAFDATAVDFLERLGVDVHKVSSFEVVDLPLIRRMASTGKPLIISTGMSTEAEIAEAVECALSAGGTNVILLKCTSAYPSVPEDMHLRTIPDMRQKFGVPVGLSDHTLGHAVPVAAVSLGACLVEKHFTLSRTLPGPDSDFSMEPAEFRAMVDAVRTAELALGSINYGPTQAEAPSLIFRRSVFVVEEVKRGERFSADNLRVIRPGHGLHPRELDSVLGRPARVDIARGTPLSWELIGNEAP